MRRGACVASGASAHWCRLRALPLRFGCRVSSGRAHALFPETLEWCSDSARPVAWSVVPPVGELSYRLLARVLAELFLGPVVQPLPELAVACHGSARHDSVCPSAVRRSSSLSRLGPFRGASRASPPCRTVDDAVSRSRMAGSDPRAAWGSCTVYGSAGLSGPGPGCRVGRRAAPADANAPALARQSSPAAPLGARPTLAGVCTVLRRRLLGVQSFVDSNCASRGIRAALMVEAQMRLPLSLRCRPSSMKMSSMTVPSACRNGVATSM